MIHRLKKTNKNFQSYLIVHFDTSNRQNGLSLFSSHWYRNVLWYIVVLRVAHCEKLLPLYSSIKCKWYIDF
jgi:hypothetical protein